MRTCSDASATAWTVSRASRFMVLSSSWPRNRPSRAHIVQPTPGFTTVRIELFVDDPEAVRRRAVTAGAASKDPVKGHTYPNSGPRPIRRMLQGADVDPFGHMWLIGKILE